MCILNLWGSLSQKTVERSGKTFEVLLFAADEMRLKLGKTTCEGKKGNKKYLGDFKLISIDDEEIMTIINNSGSYFVRGMPHDGLKKIRDPKTNIELIAVLQYVSCEYEEISIYNVGDHGRSRRILKTFINPSGNVEFSDEGHWKFCYRPDEKELCEVYEFNGENFEPR